MLDLLNMNKNLQLIIKVTDKEKNYIIADKMLVDYLDNENRLTSKVAAKKCEVYFSSDINERDQDIKFKTNDLLSLIENIDKVDFTFFDGFDNISIEHYNFDIYNNKVVLNLFISYGSLTSSVPYLDAAIGLFENDSEEIVNFIFDDFKDEIYRYLNVKSKGSLENLFCHEEYKVRENTYNYLTEFVDTKIKMMSKENLINFIKVNYDADFIFDEKKSA